MAVGKGARLVKPGERNTKTTGLRGDSFPAREGAGARLAREKARS